MSRSENACPGPYRAEFAAIHYEGQSGFLFTVSPGSAADEVARALNVANAVPGADGAAVRALVDAALSVIDWCDLVAKCPDEFRSPRPDANLRGPAFDRLRAAVKRCGATG